VTSDRPGTLVDRVLHVLQRCTDGQRRRIQRDAHTLCQVMQGHGGRHAIAKVMPQVVLSLLLQVYQ
jgi:hypothetical protein